MSEQVTYKILATVFKSAAEQRVIKVHRAYPINGIWTLACGSSIGFHKYTILDEKEYTGPKTRICGNCWRFQITVKV